MENCSLLAQADEKKYQDYVDNHPGSAFEHTLLWKEILEENFGFKPLYVVFEEGGGTIKGVLPLFLAKSIFGKRIVSTPYAVHTGTLADSEEIREKLILFARDLARREKAGFLEIREKEERASFREFKLRKEVFNFSLQLSDSPERVWKKLPKGSVRWGIKTARQSGLTWRVGNSAKELNEFYDLFVLTRKFRGVPGYPYSYFAEIINKFGDKAKIYLAMYGENPLASIFLIFYKKEMRYAFAGAVQDRKMLKLQPYHLILWEAIKEACLNGYEQFNLGGATLNTNEGGLYEFKKKWADKIREIPHYFYLCQSKGPPAADNAAMFKAASAVWKRLPLRAVKLLSPKVIRQFV
ncbi:MAG: peptidoglycan bridge formation glycyltransferase FemA/FemB family protein [Nanoarchaeota archaeon]